MKAGVRADRIVAGFLKTGTRLQATGLHYTLYYLVSGQVERMRAEAAASRKLPIRSRKRRRTPFFYSDKG